MLLFFLPPLSVRLFVAGTQISQEGTHFKNVNTIYIWALFKVFSLHGACNPAILIQRGRKVECKLCNFGKINKRHCHATA